ncbi:hypothetical protein [Azospirillum argentinense]
MAAHTVTPGNLGKKAGVVRVDRKKNSGRGLPQRTTKVFTLLLQLMKIFIENNPFG